MSCVLEEPKKLTLNRAQARHLEFRQKGVKRNSGRDFSGEPRVNFSKKSVSFLLECASARITWAP